MWNAKNVGSWLMWTAQKCLSYNLKRIRADLEITQAQAAELINVGVRAYQTWEQEWYFPDTNSLDAISKAFKVPMAELFLEPDGKPQNTKQKKAEERSVLAIGAWTAEDLLPLMKAMMKMSKVRTAVTLALIHNDQSYLDHLPPALAEAVQPLKRVLKLVP